MFFIKKTKIPFYWQNWLQNSQIVSQKAEQLWQFVSLHYLYTGNGA
jgi:hypothetical protein